MEIINKLTNRRTYIVLGLAVITVALYSFSASSEDAPAPPAAPATAAAPAAAETAAVDPESVAALVKGQPIKIKDIDADMKRSPQTANLLTMIKDPAMLQSFRRRVLDNMINRQLLIDEAKASGATVDAAALEQVITGIEGRAGGKEQFLEQLKGMGLSYEQFQQDVQSELLINRYVQENLLKGATVTEADLKKQFDANPAEYAQPEAVHVRHILIKSDQGASAEDAKKAKDQIDQIYADVTKPGADFAEIAKQKSQCPSAPKGGDLGFISKGQTVAPFEQASWALKPGEISKPVQSQFGYHVIKMEERKSAQPASFESAKAQIEQQLLGQKQSELLKAKIDGLRSAAKVEIKL